MATFTMSAAEAMGAQRINFRATVVTCTRAAESGAKAKTNRYVNYGDGETPLAKIFEQMSLSKSTDVLTQS